jgi:hypothetical protein
MGPDPITDVPVVDTSTPEATQKSIDYLLGLVKSLTEQVKELTLEKEAASQSKPHLKLNTQVSTPVNKKRKEDVLNSSNESDSILFDQHSKADEINRFRPPPFFIKKDNAKSTMDNILSKLEVSKELKPIYVTMNNGTVKILTKTEEIFRKVRNILDDQKTEYHCHQLKSDKPYRIVVRGLHPETNPEEIKDEFAQHGHIAEKITNIIVHKKARPDDKDSPKIKIPLPLFFVDLTPKTNNKEAYEIKYLAYQKVRIEEPKSRAYSVVQCKNCQELHHTRNFCKKQSRCVKCGGTHATSSCQKPKTTKPKCAGCGGPHTANWKGCPIFKAAIERKKGTKITAVDRIRNKQFNTVRSDITYTQVVNPTANPQIPTTSNATTQVSTGTNSTSTLTDILVQIANLSAGFNSFKADVIQRLERLEVNQPAGKRKKKSTQ